MPRRRKLAALVAALAAIAVLTGWWANQPGNAPRRSLAELLRRPGMTGHAITTIAQANRAFGKGNPRSNAHLNERLRELLRATIEGLQGDCWPYKFPEAAAELRAVLRLVDEHMGKPGAPLMIDLGGRKLSNTELAPRLKEIKALIWAEWPRRWHIYDHLERAQKIADLAFCD